MDPHHNRHFCTRVYSARDKNTLIRRLIPWRYTSQMTNFKNKQSSFCGGSARLVRPLKGLVGIEPPADVKQIAGCSFASWTPLMVDGGLGAWKRKLPVSMWIKSLHLERRTLTDRRTGVSYPQKGSYVRCGAKCTLVSSITKIDNLRGVWFHEREARQNGKGYKNNGPNEKHSWGLILSKFQS